MKPRIFITRKLTEEAVAPLHEKFDVRMWDEESVAVPRAVLLKEVAEADALWSVLADSINREVFEAGTKLKIVANMAVGYNNIDLESAKEYDVIVTNTPGVLTETTADLAFALLLATARKLISAENEIRKGNWTSWAPMRFTGMDVGGATLGIIGMGRIGEAVARRAKGFDMQVLYHNRNRKPDAEAEYGLEFRELDTLLKEADFVIILAPFTPETAGMIGARELDLMKNTGVLINVARGGIVDEAALYDALKNGAIWAAGLDVFEKEPIPLDHPLLTLPNVTVLPHIGSASIKTRLAMMNLNAQAITDVLEGRKPKGIVQ
ncbi:MULTISPECIES: D-glycerate dehydrogenase [Sporosarcina]|uniref:2-hydroxyacid dehydrogenase n=1 Tax=Sporosarcina TaxID=1569 RepID=UPI00078D540E|nr:MULTISPECIES: D-glycerate dehydrogenase [Sporosarcina]AMQ08058.1 D-glycerate dehydrogenase [Sporosarcina psychrophila]QNK87858.1 D-glycerate dehydrogenase [Sporosarcina sp. resist]